MEEAGVRFNNQAQDNNPRNNFSRTNNPRSYSELTNWPATTVKTGLLLRSRNTNTNQIEILVYESLTSGSHHIFRPPIIYNPIPPCCCRGIVEVGDAVDSVMSLEHQTPIIVDPEM